MSLILGLDLSLNHTGWCRFDTITGARTFDTLDYSKLRNMERIAAATKDIVELLRPANLVVMEGLSMGLPQGKSGPFVPQGRADLIGLTYIIRLWLWKTTKPALIVAPTCCKRFTTGSGKAEKGMMIREVFRRWQVEADDDNQADAVALAEMGRAYLDPGPYKPTEFQIDALTKVQVLVGPGLAAAVA